LDGQIVASLRAQPGTGGLPQQSARLRPYPVAAIRHAHHAKPSGGPSRYQPSPAPAAGSEPRRALPTRCGGQTAGPQRAGTRLLDVGDTNENDFNESSSVASTAPCTWRPSAGSGTSTATP